MSGRDDAGHATPRDDAAAEPTRRLPGDAAVPETDPVFLARFKEFGPTTFALAHRTSVVMLFLIVSLAGTIAYRTIPKESSPEIAIPLVAVNTSYAGVSPADIETLVTRPLEDELNTIAEVREMMSTSVEGYSSITVEFSVRTDLTEALQKVREKVDLARPKLPADAEEPTIVEFNFSDFPIMQVNLAGEYGLLRLKEIGEELQDRIEQLPQVLRVDLRGGLEREVKVDVDLRRLKYYGLALADVVDAIRDEHVNIPGGSIDVGAVNYLVRVDGELADPAIIGDLVVGVFDDRPVFIRDVAAVDFGFADRTSHARLDGVPVVTLDVVKRAGENIIATADAVKAIIAAMQPHFPPTTQVSITGDESRDIHMMVSSLENNIIAGLILILAVLLFFLGVRTAAFVALAIPTSMLLSFIVLALLGISMNMVVLFSLILALGMLVDNAIVIVENIHRYMDEGWSPLLAARKATGEVALPVVAATATTLAAFAPLLFWPGVVGEFMKYLPLTLIVTLSSSLFVALVIVPTLCALLLRPEHAAGGVLTPAARRALMAAAAFAVLLIALGSPLTAALLAVTATGLFLLHRFVLAHVARTFQTRWMPALVRRYERSLRWALGHRLVVVGGCVVAFIGGVALFMRFNHGVEFFPENIPPEQILVDIEAAVGTRVAFTDDIARTLETRIRGLPGYDDVESVVTTSGAAGGNMMLGGSSAENEARITLSMVEYKQRRQDSFRTLALLQHRLATDVVGAEVRIDGPEHTPGGGAPVSIEVIGPDPLVLKRLSDEILGTLRNAPVAARLVGLESNLNEARPELSVHVDRERASRYGLSTAEIGRTIRGAIQGIEAAKYRTGNDEHDIVVRLAEPHRNELSALRDLVVVTDDGAQVPLLSVARWEVGEGLGAIVRKDMDRLAAITSDVRAGYNQNAVLAEVQATLADFVSDRLPPGYQLRYTGQLDDQNEAQEFLGLAFGIALLLIAFILVSQFNSVVKPLIILSSVVMSTIGVLLGLLVFNMPFVIIMTGVGIISLAGIVVNNAIVLIDYIDVLRQREGMPRREALVRGGITRFRPVVLTAITTALGLVPLAIGLNVDFFGFYRSLSPDVYWGGVQAAWWAPMAIAVIVGIIFATFLTLIMVPVLYSLADDMTDRLRALLVTGGRADAAGAGTREAAAGKLEGRAQLPGRKVAAGAVPALPRGIEAAAHVGAAPRT
jgi:multidrug efflux pump